MAPLINYANRIFSSLVEPWIGIYAVESASRFLGRVQRLERSKVMLIGDE